MNGLLLTCSTVTSRNTSTTNFFGERIKRGGAMRSDAFADHDKNICTNDASNVIDDDNKITSDDLMPNIDLFHKIKKQHIRLVVKKIFKTFEE